MGGSKDAMLAHEEDVGLATRYLVSIGSLDKCEHHGTVFGGGFWDLESEFYRNAMADRKRGDRGPVPWAAQMETRDYTDLLKEAYETHCGDSCSACDNLMAD